MSHKHEGVHHHANMKGKKLGFSILLNVLITVAQLIGGLLSGSLSLLSDALHNFSDVIALLISYIADKLTKKACTPQQTFGYKRAEIIAAFINAVTLIAIAFNLIREAIIRFMQPVVIESIWVIVLAGLSILVNGGSVLLLKKEASESMNIKSAYLHLFTDMITSVAVLLGGIAMYFWKFFWVDSSLSILISIYLAYSSWGLLMQTLKVLMQFAPPELDLKAIEAEVLQIPEIANIHHVHVWQLNDKEYQFKAHLDFQDDLPLSKATRITIRISTMLREKFHIAHVVLQQEYGIHDDKHLVVDER